MSAHEAASIFVTALGIACFLGLVAYNLGRIEGRTIKLRSACEIERLDTLKGGYWMPVKEMVR